MLGTGARAEAGITGWFLFRRSCDSINEVKLRVAELRVAESDLPFIISPFRNTCPDNEGCP